MKSSTVSATRKLALLLSLAVGLSACGGGDGGLDIGVRRVALNFVFEDEALAEPARPETIIRVAPLPPEVQQPADLERFRTPPAAPEVPISLLCPAAPAGAAPAIPVTFEVDGPPAVGGYSRHNKGTIDIKGGPFDFRLPFPPWSTWKIPAVEQVEEEETLEPGQPPVVHAEFDIHKIVYESFKVIDRFRLNSDDQKIQLVRRTTVNDGVEQIFEPSPPIDFYVFGVEGDEWTSAGVDDERGTAMLFEARIEKREVVDVCGEVIDTYRVVASETMVNLRTGDTSGTSDDDPNVYNVATQYGGMVIREDIHSTITTRDPETGAPLLIELDYVSTLDSIQPSAIAG